MCQVPGSVKGGYVVMECHWQKERGNGDRDEKLSVLTDQLISQPLMFSACGSHRREREKRKKG